MDLKELYWAAGFLEGEGCFISIKHTKRKEGYKHSFMFYVRAGQNEIEPLHKLQFLFGGSIHLSKDRRYPDRHHIWQLGGAKARGLMLTLYPLLFSKRQQQIKEVLLRDEDWKTNNKGKWTNGKEASS